MIDNFQMLYINIACFPLHSSDYTFNIITVIVTKTIQFNIIQL